MEGAKTTSLGESWVAGDEGVNQPRGRGGEHLLVSGNLGRQADRRYGRWGARRLMSRNR